LIEFIIKDEKLRASLKKRGVKIRDALSDGLMSGMRLFESHIVKNQMSGRRGAGYGLNRQTGTLARSWKIRKRVTANDEVISLGTSTPYARIHQFGGMAGRNRSVRIPKRLHVLEDFQSKGDDFLMKGVKTKLRNAVRG
jgi:phage gpG-like protein